MSTYTITRSQAIEYLTRILENLDAGRNSPNPIARHISIENYHRVETALQYVDTGEGQEPTEYIRGALGDVVIVEEDDNSKQFYPDPLV